MLQNRKTSRICYRTSFCYYLDNELIFIIWMHWFCVSFKVIRCYGGVRDVKKDMVGELSKGSSA